MSTKPDDEVQLMNEATENEDAKFGPLLVVKKTRRNRKTKGPSTDEGENNDVTKVAKTSLVEVNKEN